MSTHNLELRPRIIKTRASHALRPIIKMFRDWIGKLRLWYKNKKVYNNYNKCCKMLHFSYNSVIVLI
ncbi:MAG: hypothetical protein ACTSPQ_09155 [Candidatus Helarchaeota archaeon]